MVVVTKTLSEKYYGKPITYSYWNSCHNGGNQGLNEAQRYPDDFDGIIAETPPSTSRTCNRGPSTSAGLRSKTESTAPVIFPSRS